MDSEKSIHLGVPALCFALGAGIGVALGVLLSPSEDARRGLKAWLRRETEELAHKKSQLTAAYQAGRRAYARADGARTAA